MNQEARGQWIVNKLDVKTELTFSINIFLSIKLPNEMN